MTKINDYLEKCKYLEILKMTIEHKLDSDNIDTALEASQASEMFIADVSDEIFVQILFASYMEQRFPSAAEPTSPTYS